MPTGAQHPGQTFASSGAARAAAAHAESDWSASRWAGLLTGGVLRVGLAPEGSLSAEGDKAAEPDGPQRRPRAGWSPK